MVSLPVQKGQQPPWVVWDTALSWSDPGLRTLREVAGIDRVVFGSDNPCLRRELAVACRQHIETSGERADGCPRRHSSGADSAPRETALRGSIPRRSAVISQTSTSAAVSAATRCALAAVAPRCPHPERRPLPRLTELGSPGSGDDSSPARSRSCRKLQTGQTLSSHLPAASCAPKGEWEGYLTRSRNRHDEAKNAESGAWPGRHGNSRRSRAAGGGGTRGHGPDRVGGNARTVADGRAEHR